MNHKRWTMVAVILGSGIVFLDSTIVPVALPQIGAELSSTWFEVLEGQSYVYYSYLLALSALLILAGALTDYHGRRRIFTLGLVGFGVTSALCGLAPNMELLIAGRILQGAAGAMLVPASLSIITATFQGEEQGRAFGIWAGASAVTTIISPLIGGASIAYLSWRAAFLINIPLIALALWATRVHVQESRDTTTRGHSDWIGSLIVVAAVGGLTFGAIRGQAQQWQATEAFVALVVGGLATLAFPWWMKRARDPLVPLELFRSRNFMVTNLSTLLIYAAIYLFAQFSALFAIGILGYNEVAFGVAGVPATLLLAAFSTRFGTMAGRHGPRVFMTAGPILMGLGILWFARIPRDSRPWAIELGEPATILPPQDYLTDLLPGMVVFGLGLMIMVAPLTTALMRSVPRRHAGVASAFNNAVSRVGPQLGGAALFIVITSSFYGALEAQLPGLDTSSARTRAQVSPLNPVDPSMGANIAEAATDASTDAFHLAMLAAGLLCCAGGVVNAFGIDNAAAHPSHDQPPAVTVRPPVVEG